MLAPHGVEVRYTKISHAGADGGGPRARRRCSPSSLDGGFIIPEFLPAFDATAAFVALLELLARSGRPLSDVGRRSCPRSTLVTETVVTPWEQKGAVMRSLVEQVRGIARSIWSTA